MSTSTCQVVISQIIRRYGAARLAPVLPATSASPLRS
jgi:hypothetical protein